MRPDGSVLVSDQYNHNIRLISTAGIVTTFAGSTSRVAGILDGLGTAAHFNQPRGIALDAAGNLLVADASNNAIRMVSPNGNVTTLAGGQTRSQTFNGVTYVSGVNGNADGVGSDATFNNPKDVACCTSDGSAVIADTNNMLIRLVAPDGTVSTLAGSLDGYNGYFDSPVGTSALFNYASGVALDSADNIYVGDYGNSLIRRVSPSGNVTTFAGNPASQGIMVNGVGTNAQFYGPLGLAVDSNDFVYVADSRDQVIRLIAPDGTVTTVAGQANAAGTANGAAASATFNYPTMLALSSAGDLYVTENGDPLIRLVSVLCDSSQQSTSPFACVARPGFFSGPGAIAATPCPSGFTSAGGAGSVDVTSCSVKCDVAAPAGCSDIYTFDETTTPFTTGCYYGNAASGLSSGSWAAATSGADSPGASVCSDCAVGLVSPGWAAGASAASSDCLNTTLTVVSVACDTSAASSGITVSFSGGEAQIGQPPSTEDINDANAEVLSNPRFAGTAALGSCTATLTVNGAFECTGFTADIGYECATAGQEPVASLATSTAAFACLVDGTMNGVFTGGNYPDPTVNQVSSVDLALVNALTVLALPAGVAAKSDFAIGAVSSTLTSTCVVTAVDTVTCFGYNVSSGYACPVSAAPPMRCGSNMQATTPPTACQAAAGFFFATAATVSNSAATTCAGNTGNFICPAGTYGSALSALTGVTVCATGLQPDTGAVACVTAPSPPPSPPPPSPPPPSPELAPAGNDTAVYVVASMSLTGYTVATFGTTQQAQFIVGIANATAVLPSAVAITSITAAVAGSSRRHVLQAGGVVVAFSVETTNLTSPTIVVALTSLTGSPVVAVATLQAAGLVFVTAVNGTAPTVTLVRPAATLALVAAPSGGVHVHTYSLCGLALILATSMLL